MLDHLRADLRYSLTWLRRSPAFAAVAIASLGIGIGFNTALFSIVDALLLRPLPVERPDTLVDVYTEGGDGDQYATSSYPDYQDFRAQNTVFTDMAAYSPALAALKTGEQSRMAMGEVVTGNYFELLGVRALIGRTLLPEDDQPGAPRVVALSHGAWTREYGGDPSVLGQSLHLRGQAYTIVGVIDPAFHGMVPMLQPELWLPLAWNDDIESAGIHDTVPSPTGDTRLTRRGQRWLFIKGRLKEGESRASAEANLQVIMARLAAEHPATNAKRPVSVAANVRLHPVADARMRPIAAALMAGVGLVLLVACANVANMLLARASGRQKEIGIRLAIGASRGRLVRQLLTESVVLALLGAGTGLLLALFLIAFIQAIPLPVPVPIALTLRIDTRVLLFTTAVATLAGLIAGVAPALKATTPNLVAELKGDRPSMSAGRRRWSLRDGLVAAQTAVTLVLLVAAGLLTRSILEARGTDLGFQPAGLAVLGTDVGLIGYDEARATALYERAIERIRALPGVEAAAATVRQPMALNYNRHNLFFPERMEPGDTGVPVSVTTVDEHYFETLGVPVLRGRNFNAADTADAPRVAIVNETFARTYWPGADPLTRRFRLRTIDGPEYQVVGVAADHKVDTVGEAPTPYVHYALAQRPSTGADPPRPHPRRRDGARRHAAPDGAGARTQRRLSRQPDDGRAGGHDAAARPARRADRRGRRARGDAAGGGGPLRRDRLRGRAPHAGDRDPDGARRGAGRRGPAGDAAGADGGGRGRAGRRGPRLDGRPRSGGGALRRQRLRSAGVGRRRRRAADRGRAGQLRARPPRVTDRSVGGAPQRVTRQPRVTSVSDSSSAWSTLSACAVDSTSGGARRSALRPAPSTSTPRRNIAWTTALRSSIARVLGLPVAHELDADHQAQPAHVADQRVLLLERAQPLEQVRADGGRVRDVLRLQQTDRGVGRRAGDRIAAERAGMGPRRPRHDVGAGARDAERQARRDPLRDVDDVGLAARSARARTSCRSGPCPTAPRRRPARSRARSRASRSPWRNAFGGTR